MEIQTYKRKTNSCLFFFFYTLRCRDVSTYMIKREGTFISNETHNVSHWPRWGQIPMSSPHRELVWGTIIKWDYHWISPCIKTPVFQHPMPGVLCWEGFSSSTRAQQERMRPSVSPQMGITMMGEGSISVRAAICHTHSGKVSASLISLQRIWTSFWRAGHTDVVLEGTAVDLELLSCLTHTPSCWIALFSMSRLFFGTLFQLNWLEWILGWGTNARWCQ